MPGPRQRAVTRTPDDRQYPVRLVISYAIRHKSGVIPDNLLSTLTRLTSDLRVTEDPWWVLGSAAAALKGYAVGSVGDVDVLVSLRDADRLSRIWQIDNCADGGTGLYRSAIFLTPHLGPVPVEVMAGYEIRQGDDWLKVWPETREIVSCAGMDMFVPADADLIQIFQWLGRQKDHDRLAAMQR